MSLATKLSTLVATIGTDVKSLRDTKQPLDSDLTAIAALSGTSGVLKKTATNTWVLDTTGNSTTATSLQTARNISLSGGVTGSASFDGSANISITATVADNSHSHTIANVTGLQTALDAKCGISDAMAISIALG